MRSQFEWTSFTRNAGLIYAIVSAIFSNACSPGTFSARVDAADVQSDSATIHTDAFDRFDTTVRNDVGAPNTDSAPVPDTHVTRVVGQCDALGAVDQLEEITPPDAAGSPEGMLHLLTDPVHSGTLYIGTGHAGLFRSTNCGSTWTKVNTGRNGDHLDSGMLWSMAIDPIDPMVLYVIPLYGSPDPSLEKSTNGGIDWDSLAPEGSDVAETATNNFAQEISIDPTDHTHLVESFHNGCQRSAAWPSGFGGCLAETTDSGATWRIFASPLPSSIEGARPHVINRTTWIYGTFGQNIWYTNDRGDTWENVGPASSGQFYQAMDGSYYTGTFSNFGILRSVDGHAAYTPIPGSPVGAAIIGDGTRLFTAAQDGAFFSALERENGAAWTPLATPERATGGLANLAYDPDHHVLYSANTTHGLWRMVTQ